MIDTPGTDLDSFPRRFALPHIFFQHKWGKVQDTLSLYNYNESKIKLSMEWRFENRGNRTLNIQLALEELGKEIASLLDAYGLPTEAYYLDIHLKPDSFDVITLNWERFCKDFNKGKAVPRLHLDEVIQTIYSAMSRFGLECKRFSFLIRMKGDDFDNFVVEYPEKQIHPDIIRETYQSESYVGSIQILRERQIKS